MPRLRCSAYLGMTPRRHQSGELDLPGPASPATAPAWFAVCCWRQPIACHGRSTLGAASRGQGKWAPPAARDRSDGQTSRHRQPGVAGSFGRARLLLKDDLGRLLVLANPKKGRVAHLTGGRPFGESDLCHQLRFDPGGGRFVLHALLERRGCRPQRPQFRVQVLEHGMRKPGAHMANVAPGASIPHRQHQAPK